MNLSRLRFRVTPRSLGLGFPVSNFRSLFVCLSLAFTFSLTSFAQDQTINGNLTVTGSIGAGGAIDTDNNTLSFGTQSGSFAAALIHQDNNTDTFTFLSNRNPASWLWQHTAGIAAMRLDSAHQLILYQADGITPGVTLAPSSNAIKLGAHANGTLTADANGVITAGGGFAALGGITNTNGVLTGGATGLNLNAGGTNQSITLNSSGGDLLFSTSSIERMRITSAGNVGIGTSAPTAKFDVEGNVRVGSGAHAGWGDVYLSTNSSWGTNAYPTIGSIGGTTGSLIMLHNPHVPFRTDNAAPGNSGRAGIRAAINTSGSTWWDFGLAGDFFHIYRNGTGEFLRVTNAGNVGIGTAVPGAKLHLQAAATSAEIAGLHIQNSGITANTAIRNVVALTDNYQVNTNGRFDTLVKRQSDGSVDVSYLFSPGASGTPVARVYMDGSTGNVGIGTSAPSAHLHISSPAYVGGGGPVVRLSNAHDSNALTMDAYTNNTPHSYAGQGIGGSVRILMNPVGGYYGMIGTNNASRFHIITNATPRVTVSDTGNVGIGATSPANKLEVEGAVVMANGALSSLKANAIFADYFSAGSVNRFFAVGPNNSTDGALLLGTASANATIYSPTMTLTAGNVGIGTTSPTHKLAVNGTIRAKEVIVDTGWADYVFEEDYRLAPLAEVEQHIREKKHLPGIPSAAEVAEHGVSMGDMQSKLLSKVEELTLHLIRMEKENAELRQRVETLETAATNP